MRLVIARCSVDYAGRLSAHLPLATRLLMVKSDGSLLVHSDGGSYKPLNWMSPPCTLTVLEPDADQQEAGVVELWKVTQAKTADILVVSIHEVLHDSSHEMGVDPGLTKDGVEADLQKLLAEQIDLLETAIIRDEPPVIYESFKLDRSYAYGIGLRIVQDVEVINQAAIEAAIDRFLAIGETDWVSSKAVPRDHLPLVREREALASVDYPPVQLGIPVR